MNVFVVHAHRDPDSFAHAILERAVAVLGGRAVFDEYDREGCTLTREEQ